MQYYQERNGDYLVVWTENGHVRERLFTDERVKMWEGRATGIRNLPSSCATTQISSRFLMGCRKVNRADVPREWLKYLG